MHSPPSILSSSILDSDTVETEGHYMTGHPPGTQSPSLTHVCEPSVHLGCLTSAEGGQEESDSRRSLPTFSYSLRTIKHLWSLLPRKCNPKSSIWHCKPPLFLQPPWRRSKYPPHVWEWLSCDCEWSVFLYWFKYFPSTSAFPFQGITVEGDLSVGGLDRGAQGAWCIQVRVNDPLKGQGKNGGGMGPRVWWHLRHRAGSLLVFCLKSPLPPDPHQGPTRAELGKVWLWWSWGSDTDKVRLVQVLWGVHSCRAGGQMTGPFQISSSAPNQ